MSGSGLSSFVRGSGASYSRSGRCRSGAEARPKVRSQLALCPSASARPLAPAGPKRLSPIASQSPARGSGSDCLTARGSLPASNSVHHSAPVGGPPGRLKTVWRIQALRPPAGSAARR